MDEIPNEANPQRKRRRRLLHPSRTTSQVAVKQLSLMNAHLICGLCGGYLITATVLPQCLHPFCRSCLLLHLSSASHQHHHEKAACPLCQLPLQHDSRLTYDASLQHLVYKLVPGLLRREMRRIRDFYSGADSQACSGAERWCLLNDRDAVSVTLSSSSHLPADDTTATIHLLCPCRVTVAQLAKFLSLKFDLASPDEVTLYRGVDSLDPGHSLLEVGFVYRWDPRTVLALSFVITGFAADGGRCASAAVEGKRRRRISGVVESTNGLPPCLDIVKSKRTV